MLYTILYRYVQVRELLCILLWYAEGDTKKASQSPVDHGIHVYHPCSRNFIYVFIQSILSRTLTN